MTGFPLSPSLVMTAAVAQACDEEPKLRAFVTTCIRRYVNGDDGDCDLHDKRVNRQAVKDGSRIIAAYVLPEDIDCGRDDRLWIITDADIGGGVRYATTILWPSDY
jgi:hypothetical protein